MAAPNATISLLPVLPVGWSAASYTPLADGTLAILATDVDLDSHAAANGRVWTFDGSVLSEGPTFPLDSLCPVIDRFADGRWLVTGARTNDSANGVVLTTDGHEVRRIHLGDGIFWTKIDDADRIWVGWFDEGVFGNPSWSVPGLEWPPSSYGLAAFDQLGGLVAHAEGVPASSGIADCYALNVFGDTVWACTYPDFPLGCLTKGGQWRWWTTELIGTRALAADGCFVLAAGGYGEEGNRIVLLRLGDSGPESLGEWRLPLMAGFPQRVDCVDGRGDRLHIVDDGKWYQWRVSDFVDALQS